MTITLLGPPIDGIGGIQTYLRILADTLRQLGHVVYPVSKRDLTLLFMASNRLIVTHRHYLPLLLLTPWRKAILLLHGIDAELPVRWYERLALRQVTTIWAISNWTKGKAEQFGKPTEVLYLCNS